MRIVARSAAALLTTAVVVGGTATAANAQATTVKDRSGDVVSYADVAAAEGTVLGYTDSVNSGTDVRSMKVKHSKKSVTVTVKYANLGRSTSTSVAFRVPGKSQPSRVFVSTGRSSGRVIDLDGDKQCSASVKTKLGKNGSLKATIKRSCLGNPKKLKASGAAVKIDEAGAVSVDVVSPNKNDRVEFWTKWLKAS